MNMKNMIENITPHTASLMSNMRSSGALSWNRMEAYPNTRAANIAVFPTRKTSTRR